MCSPSTYHQGSDETQVDPSPPSPLHVILVVVVGANVVVDVVVVLAQHAVPHRC
jgi:hypothetical protein